MRPEAFWFNSCHSIPWYQFNLNFISIYIHKIFIIIITVIGGTDSRFMCRVCPNVYRFSPIVLDGESLKLMHNVGERIAVKDVENAVKFLASIIQMWD